jgi:diaminopimelate epimerase
MRFTKMHGLGNDYVYVNCFKEQVSDPAALAISVSDRHFGIGSDGLILICPSKIADVRMRMFNADGSESQMCGNGIRCVAKYTFDHKVAMPGPAMKIGSKNYSASLKIETGNGVLTLGLEPGKDKLVDRVCVNMGEPILEPEKIPVALEGDRIVNVPFSVDGQEFKMTCVSMGNPHAVFFVEHVSKIDLESLGPIIENHKIFTQWINTHFVEILSRGEFKMRTWERGSGVTLACGTGACASAVAAVLTGKCDRGILAHLPGGDLELNWSAEDNCVYMTGPATEVFSGEWKI